MGVKLELTNASELTKLLLALAESQIEYTLQKAERKNRGKSNKMDVLLDLLDPQSLLTLLQLEGIEFSLIKAEMNEVPSIQVTYQPAPAPVIYPWLTQPIPLGPLAPIGPGIIPNPPVVWPGTTDPYPSPGGGTGDPLPFDFYKTTCETAVGLGEITTTDQVDMGNACTVQGQTFDNFTGKLIQNLGSAQSSFDLRSN